MPDTLVGTGAMLRLALRRDRWLLPVWIVAFAAMASTAATAGRDLFPDEASRVEAARTLNATASMVALFGRVYDETSLGALSLIKYTAFMTAVIAVLFVVVTVRHTRGDEETGRVELVHGARVGRDAPLVAALCLSAGGSLLLGLLSAAALSASGLPVTGSLLFGLGWAAAGLAYSAVAGVAAQVVTTSRAAIGLSSVVIAVTYALRAVGDLAEPGPSFLSWLSPIGWVQQVRAYAGDRWWVLLLPLALVVVLVPLAFALRARRDLGGGFREERPGRATGRMGTAWGLAVRLQGRLLLAWTVAFVVFGVLLGSLVGSVSEFFTSPESQDLIRRLGGTQALTDAFLAAEIAIMGVIAAAYGLSTAARLRTEETAGHVEPLLSTRATRIGWASTHYVVALLGTTLLMAVTGVSMGVTAAAALHDGSQVGRLTVACLAQAPAAWVLASLVMLVFGWAPQVTSGVWAVYVAFVMLGEFGTLWHAPEWVMDLSPFRHSPMLPLASGATTAVVALTLVAAVLAVAGLAGWRRRDLAA